MSSVIGLTPPAIEGALQVLETNLKADEPVDSFALCNKKKLDSSLKTPFQRPEKTAFVDDLIEKSSLLFILLIENHVLPTNGNKRLATLSLLLMLYINGYVIMSSPVDLYYLAIEVTELSRNRVKIEDILQIVQSFVLSNIQKHESFDEGKYEVLKSQELFEKYLFDR